MDRFEFIAFGPSVRLERCPPEAAFLGLEGAVAVFRFEERPFITQCMGMRSCGFIVEKHDINV